MHTMKTVHRFILHTGLLVAAGAAQAQLRVEISGVGSNQIPIAIANFADESSAPVSIAAIVRADLERSGAFRLIDAGGAASDAEAPNYSQWKARGANALATGSVQRLADGRYDIRYKLLDTIQSSQLSALGQAADTSALRLAAHRIADDIYQKMTGVPGAFSTRIAYVTQSGKRYRLEVADADGEDIHVALNSDAPIISPAWSPDGIKVAYVSFEDRKPVVYVQNLVTRKKTVIANQKGSNSAPAWAPDGSKLAVALSRDGHTQVYTVNGDGSNLRRVSNSSGIDTEPQFSADGQTIYFTSDRSGGPQIYKMAAGGGDAQRVTFSGSYNISPRLSPDGKTLAYISRRNGNFQLYALDLASGQEQRLSDASNDESPSFSPNGKYILYSTDAGARKALAIVSVDGRVKQRLTTQAGNIKEPTWGPYMQ